MMELLVHLSLTIWTKTHMTYYAQQRHLIITYSKSKCQCLASNSLLTPGMSPSVPETWWQSGHVWIELLKKRIVAHTVYSLMRHHYPAEQETGHGEKVQLHVGWNLSGQISNLDSRLLSPDGSSTRDTMKKVWNMQTWNISDGNSRCSHASFITAACKVWAVPPLAQC